MRDNDKCYLGGKREKWDERTRRVVVKFHWRAFSKRWEVHKNGVWPGEAGKRRKKKGKGESMGKEGGGGKEEGGRDVHMETFLGKKNKLEDQNSGKGTENGRKGEWLFVGAHRTT